MSKPIEKQPLGEVIGSLPPDLSGVDILLPYQKELLEATARSKLVITDKSRRVGMTWAAGADAVLTSALQRSEGGQDTFYLGYNLDMAREFIDTCAAWAKSFSVACDEVEEMIFEGEGEKGERLSIKAFRITFASGFQIQALSSNARSLRGRQGFVILDEFAFHDDAKELLKAALALLIWGGRVLVISTHNGDDNPFNELIQEVRVFRRDGDSSLTFLEKLWGSLDKIGSKLTDLALNNLTDSLFGEGGTGNTGALGGIFSKLFENVDLFANGDVFDGPTMFGYGNGQLGIMGEAGKEGIMPLEHSFGEGVGAKLGGRETTLPLTRLNSGKLGVSLFANGGTFGGYAAPVRMSAVAANDAQTPAQFTAQGGGSVVNHWHVSSDSPRSFAESKATMARGANRLMGSLGRHS